MKFKLNEFIAAINDLSESKGLSHEAIINALKESIEKAYIKYLGGGSDARTFIDIDEEKEELIIANIKTVVEDVQDDYLEISFEDANKGLKKAKYKVGDDFYIYESAEDMTKIFYTGVKNNLRQRLAEAERAALYEIYKDHIGEMMTGTVERSDDHGISVNIGRTTVELGRKELIGDEYFKVGDLVKVYIQEVRSQENGKKKGNQIQATRSSEGFIKRLFEEEIHEIYDGTVLIKGVARHPGVRSKVAVVSANEDVDATGACIGPGGSRIQKIVTQLGNGKQKEKIDIIQYSPCDGLFIANACAPAKVVGVCIEEPVDGEKDALVVIEDGDTPLALGKFKSNQNLASKLTGYSIEFVEKKIADEDEIDYKPVSYFQELAEEMKKVKEKEDYLRKMEDLRKRQEEEERKAAEAAERARIEAENEKIHAELAAKEAKTKEIASMAVAPKAAANPEEFPLEAMNPAAAALALAKAQDAARKAEEEAARKAEEEAKLAKEEAAEKEEEISPTEVRTTTTLSSLEAELESAKEKKAASAPKAKRPRKITEEEVKHEPVKPAIDAIPVYTDEELKQIEDEEADIEDFYDSEEDIDQDYSEYEEYYDDDGGR
ncbi:MAG: transcription termination factor NusA [Bacilli bacterium]|nr:transcription termination factor NusA [Bacilli bacterium]MDY6430180.1 transcription termination factor NusA [Bacilli bacterium]